MSAVWSEWTPAEDTTLRKCRAAGMTFEQCEQWIPGRTAKACKRRDERLRETATPVEPVNEPKPIRLRPDEASRTLLRAMLTTGQHFIRDPAAYRAACQSAGLRRVA